MTSDPAGHLDGALADIQVLDLAGEMGQYCTKLLADLGADVIKIEAPEGDPVRNLPPRYRDHPELSLYWLNLNTNKRSLTLDIAHPKGQEILRRLAEGTDVIVESFRPGHLDALRLGYGSLSEINPGLIMTSITGFGQTGPHAGYLAPDIVGLAMSGVMWLAGHPEDPPNILPWRQGYVSASIMGAAGTLVALLYRDNAGEGQHVDVSMQEALSRDQETAMQTWDMLGVLRTRRGSPSTFPFDVPGIGVYDCVDGQVFGFLGTAAGAPWLTMLQWLVDEGEAEDLEGEPFASFIGKLNRRILTPLIEDADELSVWQPIMNHIDGVLRRFVNRRSKWVIYEEGQRRRLLWGIISSPQDIVRNPQLEYRRWLTSVYHEEIDTVLQYPGPPYRLSETPWAIRLRPPLPGEHNIEVLAGTLGMSREELRELKRQKII